MKASSIYNAYPYSDELDIDPPENDEEFETWFRRIRDSLNNCGDTCFAAILRELYETIDDKPVKSLYRMMDDIEIVIAALIAEGHADTH